MSRSYKKYTCYNINYSKSKRKNIKILRRSNNRILSNSKEVKNGGYYKKLKTSYYYDAYHRDRVTLESTILDYLNNNKSFEEAYHYWVTEYYYK